MKQESFSRCVVNHILRRVQQPWFLVLLTVVFAACFDWNDHYDESGIKSGEQEIFNGDIVSYMKSTPELARMSDILQKNGVYDSTHADRTYTFIVCADDVLSAHTDELADEEFASQFARNSVSDMEVSPAMLTDGMGIETRLGKCVWVYEREGGFNMDECKVTKSVKTANGYVYFVDGIVPIRLSVYEYLFNKLGSEYNDFKILVKTRQKETFDREHSTITGVDEQGRTTYDSIFVTRCELMDRYTKDGAAYWNMRDENYATTMFVPTNTQIRRAMKAAIDSIPRWLNRPATAADSTKFYDWIVKACFVDRRVCEAELPTEASATDPYGFDFDCVGGYQKIINEQADEVKYKEAEPAHWRPSIQRVDVSKKITCSNGFIYPCTNFKIPNHVVIYRVKTRLYQVWNAMSDKERKNYFKWLHWTDARADIEGQSSFDLDPSLPMMQYFLLCAVPDQEAMDDELPCSVTYKGLLYDEESNKVTEANLPAGEYYWSMGFKHSIQYSLSMKFNDLDYSVNDMCMYAQGSNFHFDRGAASEVPHLGTGVIAYPEGFDPDDWIKIDAKAIAYDTDGYLVDIVRLNHSGPFTITIKSNDMARIFKQQIAAGNSSVIDSNGALVRTNKNIYQLMMYHWCLRPTKNNY
ncbi:MAG: hypothetical protein Q4F34_03880 [Prevotellaceae bacterium]|nr:hypothetical protein [Prevotellaceae bacterium]